MFGRLKFDINISKVNLFKNFNVLKQHKTKRPE